MTLLPVVERELRVRARSRGTFVVRQMAATAGFLIVAILLLTHLVFSSAAALSGLGKSVFSTLAGITFLFCLWEGARGTADSLSSEMREGTLGLLFLTDLRGHDVVLGKLVASSVNSIYGLMAVFPAMAIPLVLGGVTGDEFWRQMLALFNALFFSLTAGLAMSSISRDEQRARSRTVFWVVLWTAGPPFVELVPGAWSSAVAMCSPLTAFRAAFDSAYSADAARYWDSIKAVQGMSWLALLGAAALLPRMWQDRAWPRKAASLWPAWLRSRVPGGRRRKWLDENPAMWLAMRGRSLPVMFWGVIGTASVVAVGSWLLAGGSGAILLPLVFAALMIHGALSVWVAIEACHLGAAGRDSGTFDLLLTTSLPVQRIIDGHLLAMRRTFLRPVLVLVIVEVVLVLAHHFSLAAGERIDLQRVVVTVSFLLAVAAFVLELQAVATFGFWQGLCTKRAGQAVTKTALLVVILPMLLMVCLPLYPVLAIVKNLAFTNYGYDQLRRHFRVILVERYGGAELELPRPAAARPETGQLPSVLR